MLMIQPYLAAPSALCIGLVAFLSELRIAVES
jgi:hypothetical protein